MGARGQRGGGARGAAPFRAGGVAIAPAATRVTIVDWRNDPRLPRSPGADHKPLYFERRRSAIAAAIVHHTAGDEDILVDNDYHRLNAAWSQADPSVHAPHIAYHFWLPSDPDAFLDLHNIPHEISPASIVVWCNELSERAWHANLANDTAVGIAAQGNGELRPLSAAQEAAILYVLDELLPSQGIRVPRARVFGHGETPRVHGGGPDWGNATVCPGRYVLEWVRRLRGG